MARVFTRPVGARTWRRATRHLWVAHRASPPTPRRYQAALGRGPTNGRRVQFRRSWRRLRIGGRASLRRRPRSPPLPRIGTIAWDQVDTVIQGSGERMPRLPARMSCPRSSRSASRRWTRPRRATLVTGSAGTRPLKQAPGRPRRRMAVIGFGRCRIRSTDAASAAPPGVRFPRPDRAARLVPYRPILPPRHGAGNPTPGRPVEPMTFMHAVIQPAGEQAT